MRCKQITDMKAEHGDGAVYPHKFHVSISMTDFFIEPDSRATLLWEKKRSISFENTRRIAFLCHATCPFINASCAFAFPSPVLPSSLAIWASEKPRLFTSKTYQKNVV